MGLFQDAFPHWMDTKRGGTGGLKQVIGVMAPSRARQEKLPQGIATRKYTAAAAPSRPSLVEPIEVMSMLPPKTSSHDGSMRLK